MVKVLGKRPNRKVEYARIKKKEPKGIFFIARVFNFMIDGFAPGCRQKRNRKVGACQRFQLYDFARFARFEGFMSQPVRLPLKSGPLFHLATARVHLFNFRPWKVVPCNFRPWKPVPCQSLAQPPASPLPEPCQPPASPCQPPGSPLAAPCQSPASPLPAPCQPPASPLPAPCRPPANPLSVPCQPPANPLASPMPVPCQSESNVR